MGLDSVELLMEMENYFGISISDSEAEKIYTVQQMVDTVARIKNITDDSTGLRDAVLERVNKALIKLAIISQPLHSAECISAYLAPEKTAEWSEFVKELQLEIPRPNSTKRSDSSIINKIKEVFHWSPMYDWHSLTVSQFVYAICAMNYEVLLPNGLISTKDEIYIAVVAITVSKIGVEYYEISPEKSFTSDLGID